MFLAASSNTGTIHIFRLITQKEKYVDFCRELVNFKRTFLDHRKKQIHGWVHLIVY
jgi:hypothetical protein